MKVIYINHSGFLLEWERCYWLFDYYRGNIPKLDPEKPVFVFSSHSHEDHFNPEIFALARVYPRVTYVFSNQIRSAYRKLRHTSERVIFLPSGTDTELSDGCGGRIQIHTLISTDCGCGFVLSYEGKRIYHAGDLHWWTWPGESESENRDMTARYKKQIEYLAGQQVDLAFTPLDPRQEQDYALGMNYLSSRVRIRHLFPMHFWNDFSIQEKYLSENPVPEHTVFHQIMRDGQVWEITLDGE